MIRAKGIEKSYLTGKTPLPVLKGVNLDIASGEIVSIVGESGTGKSTLLQILGTLDKADKGEIFLNHQNLAQIKGNQLAKFRNKHIGFVFQFHNLLPEFTALENVCMPAYLAKTNKKISEQKALELLDFLGIENRKEHLPSQMSGGEQQRTAIARALINQPNVVFADEPSGNLDTKNSEELHQLFVKLRAEFEQTFVIVTHNLALANLADRKLEMKDGLLLQTKE